MLKILAAVALVLALGVATYALAGGNDSNAKKHDARNGHGPPAWAPAYGWRCKEAGNRPGSPAFKDCIKARKR